MKAKGLAILVLAGIVCGVRAAGATEADAFRVATFNIRCPVDKSPNAWPERGGRVRGVMERHAFDVVGLQEATSGQIDDLLDERWAYVGVGRDDGARGGEFSCIFFRKARFESRADGTFWLSETIKACRTQLP